ncbi:hypothetical protein AB0N05_16900 [Nocardia sp. NPDC051030]|uniref:hypothetical protein n=1 Tax=Nocardia sp. NPDC051030 TaxID=3155162 RepID=UPI00341E368B
MMRRWRLAARGHVVNTGLRDQFEVANPNATEDIDLLIRQFGCPRRIDYVLVGASLAHPRAFARIRSAALAFDKAVDGVWASYHFGLVVDLENPVSEQISELGRPAR